MNDVMYSEMKLSYVIYYEYIREKTIDYSTITKQPYCYYFDVWNALGDV